MSILTDEVNLWILLNSNLIHLILNKVHQVKRTLRYLKLYFWRRFWVAYAVNVLLKYLIFLLLEEVANAILYVLDPIIFILPWFKNSKLYNK